MKRLIGFIFVAFLLSACELNPEENIIFTNTSSVPVEISLCFNDDETKTFNIDANSSQKHTYSGGYKITNLTSRHKYRYDGDKIIIEMYTAFSVSITNKLDFPVTIKQDESYDEKEISVSSTENIMAYGEYVPAFPSLEGSFIKDSKNCIQNTGGINVFFTITANDSRTIFQISQID